MKKKRSISRQRRELIRLLTDNELAVEESRRELVLISELINSGYLAGEVIPSTGPAESVVLTGLTTRGRLFTWSLLAQERESSWWFKSLQVLWFFLGTVVGALIPIVTDVLRSALSVALD